SSGGFLPAGAPASWRRWKPSSLAPKPWGTQAWRGRWPSASWSASGGTLRSCWPGSTRVPIPWRPSARLCGRRRAEVDYARFVRLRRPVWDAFETELAATRGSLRKAAYDTLEDMALRYRQVLHDHALAASRFPGTAAARRLQSLAIEGPRRLTGEGRRQPAGFSVFFSRTFPRAFQRQLGLLGVVTALFLLAVVWGLTVAALRPAVGLAFLGPEAVRGLEEGRLWTSSLVTTVPPSISSSLTAWTGGVLAGVVPLYVVLLNGLMLGATLSVTMHYSLGGDLLEFISAHGLLELTLILV